MTRRKGASPPDTDTSLRHLYREELGTQPGDGAHPSEDDWVALTTGSLEPGARERMVDHVVGCDECAAVHRALTELRREAAAIDPAAPALAAVSTPRWPWYSALAAAALIVVTLGVALLTRASRDTTAAPATSTVSLSPGPVAPQPGQRGQPAAVLPSSVVAPWAASVVALDVRMPAALVMTLRGEAPTDAQRREALVRALRPALDLYRGGEYGPAATALATIAQASPDVPEIAFYAGLSHLLAGNASAAWPLLESAVASDLVGDDARWFAAIAHERLGDHDRAGETLRALCARGGPRSRDACQASSHPPSR